MNAIDLLKQDHNFVEELFQKIESTPPSRHAATIKKIKDELDTHANAEEKVFYPALKAKGNKELQDITMEGFEEHSQIKKFLKEIARSTSTEKREAKLKVLIEDVRHHVKEEEGEMFSLVEDQFSSQELEALGERLEAEKKRFQKSKRIPARRPAPAKGMLATVIDKAANLLASITGEEEGSGNGKPRRSGSKTSGGIKGSARSDSRKSASSSKTGSGKTSASTGSSSGKTKKAAAGSSGKRSKPAGNRSSSNKENSAKSNGTGSKAGTTSKAGSRTSGSKGSRGTSASKSSGK